MGRVEDLAAYLRSKPAGSLDGDPELVPLLCGAWGGLDGGREEGMGAPKLARIERVGWNPPRLSFVIERHGGTVMGSTRAELQRWTVDLSRRTATPERAGHRQLEPTGARVNVKPIAEEIARLVLGAGDDPRLAWKNAERTRMSIRIGRVIPSDGFARTISGRRKRFRAALMALIGPSGWAEVFGSGYWTFERGAAPGDGSAGV